MKLKQWWRAHRPTKRRIIQLYAALLFNANIKGFATGKIYKGSFKNICAPGINCYSCPGAVASCPMGALQNALTESGNKLPFYMIGIVLSALRAVDLWIPLPFWADPGSAPQDQDPQTQKESGDAGAVLL